MDALQENKIEQRLLFTMGQVKQYLQQELLVKALHADEVASFPLMNYSACKRQVNEVLPMGQHEEI